MPGTLPTHEAQSGSIVVRPVEPDDLPDLYTLLRDPQVVRDTLGLPSMAFSETNSWLSEAQPGHHRLIAVSNGRVTGAVSLAQSDRPRLRHSARLSMMAHPKHWSRGTGSALLQVALDLADTWLNIRRIEVGVLAHHDIAQRLYEGLGFQLEGTRRDAVFGDGRYLDEHVMARLMNPPQVSRGPAAPAFQRREDVNAIITRPMQVADAAQLHAIATHPAVARGTLQMPSMELGAVEERTAIRKPGLYRYTAVAQHVDGRERVAGSAILFQPQNPRLAHGAGLGISVHPDYWGIGVGSRLMSAVVDLADNWLALRRIELDVFTDNAPAISLYERFGFLREGTRRVQAFGDGRWNDSYFMARLAP